MKEQNPRKQRILEATIQVLKTNPVEEVSMRNIAKEAGLTTGALYHHYKNKEELFYAVMQETIHFSNSIYRNITENEKDKHGRELLYEINSNVRERLGKIEEQKFHITVLSDLLKKQSEVTDKYKENYKEVINSVGELIIKAFDLKDNPNKKFMAHFLVAAIDGMALQQAVEVLPSDMEESIDHFIKFFNESIPTYLKKNK